MVRCENVSAHRYLRTGAPEYSPIHPRCSLRADVAARLVAERVLNILDHSAPTDADFTSVMALTDKEKRARRRHLRCPSSTKAPHPIQCPFAAFPTCGRRGDLRDLSRGLPASSGWKLARRRRAPDSRRKCISGLGTERARDGRAWSNRHWRSAPST